MSSIINTLELIQLLTLFHENDIDDFNNLLQESPDLLYNNEYCIYREPRFNKSVSDPLWNHLIADIVHITRKEYDSMAQDLYNLGIREKYDKNKTYAENIIADLRTFKATLKHLGDDIKNPVREQHGALYQKIAPLAEKRVSSVEIYEVAIKDKLESLSGLIWN